MKRLLVALLAFGILGCGGLSSQASRYLKQSEPYQLQLTNYQRALKESSQLPMPQRQVRVRELLAQVQSQRSQLEQLKPPQSVTGIHRELTTLYATLEEFLKACLAGSGDTRDPKVQKLAGEWSDHLAKLQQELQKLER